MLERRFLLLFVFFLHSPLTSGVKCFQNDDTRDAATTCSMVMTARRKNKCVHHYTTDDTSDKNVLCSFLINPHDREKVECYCKTDYCNTVANFMSTFHEFLINAEGNATKEEDEVVKCIMGKTASEIYEANQTTTSTTTTSTTSTSTTAKTTTTSEETTTSEKATEKTTIRSEAAPNKTKPSGSENGEPTVRSCVKEECPSGGDGGLLFVLGLFVGLVVAAVGAGGAFYYWKKKKNANKEENGGGSGSASGSAGSGGSAAAVASSSTANVLAPTKTPSKSTMKQPGGPLLLEADPLASAVDQSEKAPGKK